MLFVKFLLSPYKSPTLKAFDKNSEVTLCSITPDNSKLQVFSDPNGIITETRLFPSPQTTNSTNEQDSTALTKSYLESTTGTNLEPFDSGPYFGWIYPENFFSQETTKCNQGESYVDKPYPLAGFDISINKSREYPKNCYIEVKATEPEPNTPKEPENSSASLKPNKWTAVGAAGTTIYFALKIIPPLILQYPKSTFSNLNISPLPNNSNPTPTIKNYKTIKH